MRRFSLLLALLSTMALAVVSTGAAAKPNQSGLVNVYVADNTVQIPIGIAANVCGVAVNILSAATATSPVTCDSTARAQATGRSGNGNGGGGNQSGLINLAIVNNTIQVPVGIAANLCQISANVLAAGTVTGPATCTADADSSAVSG